MGWDDLLPFQQLEFPKLATLAPPPRPPAQSVGYVEHLSTGGWPDVTEQGIVRDARAERRFVGTNDSRGSDVFLSPLNDRDGYTGAIPAGAGIGLPMIAQPLTRGDAKPGTPRGAKTKPPGRMRSWVVGRWAAGGNSG